MAYRQKNSNKNRAKSTAFVDHLTKARDCKDKTKGKTGIIYDERMAQHKCLWDVSYPESPLRFTSIMERCHQYKLIERCATITPREATPEELLKLHSADRLELLQGTDGSPDAEALEALSSRYDAIYIHPSTHKLALLAAGSTVELVDSLLDGRVQNGMAIIRPPGHHAMKSEYCGYCFYNNVAVAARHALDEKGTSRILIVDWDVHHGQATQQMFYDDPRVLYFSIHRYEHGSYWPELRESDYHYIGKGRGLGYNVNIPLNKTGMTDADYMAVFHQVLLPLAHEFRPELIIVSAGYDAALGCFEFCPELIIVSAGFDSALGDEKGEMEITPVCYSHLTSMLMGLANGKLAVVLEGGYCLKSLSEGAALTLRTLLGDPCPAIGPLGTPSHSIQQSILSSIYMLRPLWKCFQFQGNFKASTDQTASSCKKNQFFPTISFLGTDTKPTSYATRNCYPVQTSETFQSLDRRLDQLIKETSLAVPIHRVCLAYEERMALHRNVSEPGHPERPARITCIYELMCDYGLVERCHRLETRLATRDELLMLHDAKYVDLMASIPKMKQPSLNALQRQYGSVFLCTDSYESAVISAGMSLQIVESILSGESRSGIGIVRPPGHHAECDEAFGFCVFNNTALAAKYALDIHKLERVMIVDWDIHHGNGIQRMFEDDPRVLYISLHRLDIFPMVYEEANCNVVGSSKGAGYTINIAWPKRGMGDAEYLAAFQQIILPVASQYNPQLVLVAAGFDAAQGDPLGGCKISPEGYGQMTHMLTSFAQGKVAILLEGGYNLSSISHSMMMCTKALLGDPLPTPALEPINPAAVDTIKRVIAAQSPYWSSLQFLVDLPDANVLCPPWIRDPKIFQFNTDLISIDEQLKLLDIDDSKKESAPSEKEEEPLEACAIPLDSEEPKTLQEFLLLPENIHAMNEGTLFAVTPLTWCPHLDQVGTETNHQWTATSPCSQCNDGSENWVCLTCYQVLCGRFVSAHMVEHNSKTKHPLVISISDLSVWCYDCDSYIDNKVFYDTKNKLHMEKFNEELPKLQEQN